MPVPGWVVALAVLAGLLLLALLIFIMYKVRHSQWNVTKYFYSGTMLDYTILFLRIYFFLLLYRLHDCDQLTQFTQM